MNPVKTGAPNAFELIGHDDPTMKGGRVEDIEAYRDSFGATWVCFKPTWKDVFKLVFGAKLWVSQKGRGFNPFCISVSEDLPEKPNFGIYPH